MKRLFGIPVRKLLVAAVFIVVVFCCAFAFADDGAGETSVMYGTFWSLLPPIIAIGLALITKEVYTSLFLGIVAGCLFYTNFNIEHTLTTIFTVMGSKLGDGWNVGILIFLVILGIMVSLMNKAGGSAAFGKWASKRIKTRMGAQLATVALGCLIFIDDYFNCLTVGSVMLPVTDGHRISRAKLSYIIDATAAPVCIIAPISSWAAAVTSSVPEASGINGFVMFLETIPYNFYALLTITMMIVLAVGKFDFGPMRKHERNAEINGDLFTTDSRPYGEATVEDTSMFKGKVIDLVLPVVVLIITCVAGMVYTGGFFTGTDFITAFSSSDASVGLVLGSFIALLFMFVFYLVRRVLTFKEFTASIPEGFRAMVPAILILTFAWTLSGITNQLGSDVFVSTVVGNSSASIFLPAILFLIACGISFATGTSWGTFGILIPIVVSIFPAGMSQMLIITISACLGGAVMGDHCSPISDTTIMASTGGKSDHINHVSTQLPYAVLVALVSVVFYVVAALIQSPLVLPLAIAAMVGVLLIIKKVVANNEKKISTKA
ncbi:MAG: Na+/H+ antiporter NhaC family protein [Clostridia bacterium]